MPLREYIPWSVFPGIARMGVPYFNEPCNDTGVYMVKGAFYERTEKLHGSGQHF